jgi:heat shock protein HspQ
VFPADSWQLLDKSRPGTVRVGESKVEHMLRQRAKYHLGQVVRHRKHPFRGVVFDVDPEFNNTEEWYESIPEESRPAKKQPFYHLLAENDQSFYVAYVSEQNLVADYSGEPVDHPDIPDLFGAFTDGSYELHFALN